MRRWIAVTTLLVIGIAASAGLAQGTPPQVEAALADLNQRLGTNLTLNSQQMLWTWAENVYTDTSLGCPQPGQAYAEVITRGYVITFAVGGTIYDYRASSDGQSLFLCREYPAAEATQPVVPDLPDEEEATQQPVVTLPPANDLTPAQIIEANTATEIRELLTLENAGRAPLAWSPEGDLLALAAEPPAAAPDGGAIALYSATAPGDGPEIISLVAPATALAFAGQTGSLVTGDLNGTISVFRAEPRTRDVLRMVDPEASGPVSSVVTSSDGAIIASTNGAGSDRDNAIRLWDAASGRLMRTIETENPVSAIALSAPGNHLAYGMTGGIIVIVDLDDPDGEPLALEGHDDAVNTLKFHPADALLASGSLDGVVRLWDVPAVEVERPALEMDNGAAVLTLAFNASGSVLATGGADGAIRLWDTASGELLATLEGHATGVDGLDFSPDGAYLASISDDGTLRVWGIPEAETG